jgi:proteasome lid subunit RPN8/RPN11
MIVEVKRRVFESILLAARNVYPREFIGLLRGSEREGGVVVEELILAPLATYGEEFSSFSQYNVPLDPSIIGSVHSHPGYSNRPSKGDLEFFSTNGSVHLIACMPFDAKSVRAYDKRGKPLELAVY